MKKTMIVILVIAILLVTAGIVGNFFSNGNTSYFRRGMMNDSNTPNNRSNDEKMDIELLEKSVES